MPTPAAPTRTPLLAHLKRAFGWNLAKVVPSAAEAGTLAQAGVTEPTAQRYAVWRRSLLLVALLPTLLVVGLALWGLADEDFEGYQPLGVALQGAWLLVLLVLPVALLRGVLGWRRPDAGARLLLVAWLAAFLLPLVHALAPEELLYHVEPLPVSAATLAAADAAAALDEDLADVDVAEKAQALQHVTLKLVFSGATFLMLLPALISLIPGAMNGCLRVKSLLPAAQMPGWLLVAVAPVFLLFWLVMLVLVNPAAGSPLLVLGIVLWAGSPLLYPLQGRVFVESQTGPEGMARIAKAKRNVALCGLAGIACLITFLFSAQVVGLQVLGTDPERSFDVRLDEHRGEDHALGWAEVKEAYAESDSLVFVLDPSWLQLVLDIVAKLLIATAVFMHLVLRATLAAWRNERALREAGSASAYDAGAAATLAALRG